MTASPNSGQVDWTETLALLSPEEATAAGKIIDQSIDDAFAQGYKQGVIAWKPEAEYWKTRTLLQPEKPDRFWEGFGWGSGVGVGVGILVTATVFLAVSKARK